MVVVDEEGDFFICINLIKDMYERVVINVRTYESLSDSFPINIEFYQNSTLSFIFFTIVINEITKNIQNKIS